MNTYGIIGYPLAHSFSKKYFTEKFQRERITDAVFETFPLRSIEELDQVLENNPTLKGLNVTIPYKQLVLAKLHNKAIPEGLNACNCIAIREGKLTGHNTDVTGFERSLLPYLNSGHQNALILGNGGAAKAVAFVLQKLNIPYQIVSRNLKEDASFNYYELNQDIISQHKLIVNTTPLGTFPNVNDCAPIPYQYIGKEHLLFDLIYNPAKTFFLQKGEMQGATIVNGYEMLIIQAEESWRIWNENA